MSQKRYRIEEIVGKLLETEVLRGHGMFIEEVCRKIEVTKQTYCAGGRSMAG